MEVNTSAWLAAPEAEAQNLYPLKPGHMWKIGRSEHSDVSIGDGRVSRDHAIIQMNDDGEYYLIDMGSRNGTFVNEKRVTTPGRLRDGDKLSLGGYTLVFHRPGSNSGFEPGSVLGGDATKAWFVRHFLTVLVVDIRDFTGLSQRLDPGMLSQTMGTWFREAGEIMKRRDRWTIKYIGDAIMSVWLHNEKGMERHDVLEILRGLRELSAVTESLQSRFDLPLPIHMGAGINTGYASVGNTGGRTVADYTALGDAVNAAFRIETASKELGMEVVLGSPSFDALPKELSPDRYFHPHEVNLKGYEQPIPVWATTHRELAAFLAQLPE